MTASQRTACALVLLGVLVGSCTSNAQSPGPAGAARQLAHPVYPGGDATPLGARVAILLKDPVATRAHWGIAVTAMDGTPLYGLDEGKLFRPASTAKLFTTAAAMALLRPESRVHTGLVAIRKQSNQTPAQQGALEGDLVLEGAGDASFGTSDVPYQPPEQHSAASSSTLPNPVPDPLQAITATLARLGLKHITGDIIGDDSRWPSDPIPESWSVGDTLAGYGAPISSLSLHDNVITVQLSRGSKTGDAVSAMPSPSLGPYAVQLSVTTAAKQPDEVQLTRLPGSHEITASGTLAAGHSFSTDLPVDDPALFAAETIKAALQAQGVQIDGEARARHQAYAGEDAVTAAREPIPQLPLSAPTAIDHPTQCVDACTVLADWPSPTLADDITATLKESINLHAELMLRRLGESFGAAGTTAQGARVERQWLAGIGLDQADFIFVDGSGLSDHDLVTPRATGQLLAFAATQDWFASWKAALPIGGLDGTLAHRFLEPPLKGHVLAKTGTLGESRALAGYVRGASGREVIVAILVDNHPPESPADRTVMDKIVAAIAELE